MKIIEDFIQNQLYQFRTDDMKHLQKHGYSGLEVNSDNEKIQEILIDGNIENIHRQLEFDDFSYIMRQSFFVAAYHIFENYLQYQCEDVERKHGLATFKDFNGKGIIKIKNYLERVAAIQISCLKKWDEISAYNKLRNCIVHCDTVLYKSPHRDFLLSYIKRNPYLTYIDQIDEVRIEKGFCEEVIDNFDVFAKYVSDQIVRRPTV